MNNPTVAQQLADLGQLFADRYALYGDNYKRFGSIMVDLLGDVNLKTPDDYNRMGLFVQIVGKVTRYANQFRQGGHPDSLDDLAVYAQMLQEIDVEIRDRRHNEIKRAMAKDIERELESWGINESLEKAEKINTNNDDVPFL